MVTKTHIICSKERELGIMATKIDSIETTVSRIESKFDIMRDELPKIYATNSKVDAIEKRLIERDNIQDQKNKTVTEFLINNWFNLLLVLAFSTYVILGFNGLIHW